MCTGNFKDIYRGQYCGEIMVQATNTDRNDSIAVATRSENKVFGKRINPNAPSGASTAAPYFVDRRLLQLTALYKLQIIDQSFDI